MQSYSSDWAAGGKALLQELNIPDSERIVLLYETQPNTALLYFDRRGYTIPDFWGWKAGQIRSFMDRKGARIAVMSREKYQAVRLSDPAAFDAAFTLLAAKGRQVVLRKKQPSDTP